MAKLLVKMTKKSKLDPSTDFTGNYVANVSFDDDKLILKYKEDKHTNCEVIYSEGSLDIIRKGEVHTKLALKEGSNSIVNIETPFGVMEFDIETYYVMRQKNQLYTEYALKQDGQLIDHILITWELANYS